MAVGIRSEVIARRAAIAERHPEWWPMTLDAYLGRAATEFADRPLVINDGGEFTYAQVDAAASRAARALRQRGVQPGDHVGMLMGNYPGAVALLFGIWRAGGVAVPLNTLYRKDELGYVLGQARLRLLVAMRRFLNRDFEQDLAEVLPAGIDLLLCDPDATTLDLLPDASSGASFDVERAAHDPAVIMYTSGSTGSPKGVVQTHDNLLRAAYAGAYHQAFEDGRRAIFSLPLYHAFGLVVGLLSGLVVGGSIVPLLRFDPREMLRGIERHRASFLMGVPTMTVAMLEVAEQEAFDLSSLKAIHSGAAPTPSWVWRRIKAVLGCEEIFTSYGQTEATATIICTQPGDDIEVVATTQGIIVDGGVSGIAERGGDIAEFRIMDADTGEDAAQLTPGEIWTRGPMNSLGYFDRPADTAALFAEGGWLRTGDRGFFREDGNLVLTGRSKELFKSRGELVSPKEIEEVITTHPDVREAYVIGMPDDRYGECGCAWLVAAGADEPDMQALVAYLGERLPRYKLPRDIWFIKAEDLPRTGTGKVQKNELKARAEAMLGRGQASGQPASECVK